ncbi:Phage integrase family protein [Desulforapulum autotrophicum HRM2]|uniref:Phage integrase family protein n=1 Tax=Desulforapulum autotrophicum (strain ATCC 43914 / DSM 3382 / VKM B-1955 / HRM2) TaxID=177437 RepID=C0QHJ7_DESAH|nr:site-specific integrase [Desulforapulum autotrophicum]ACN17856.1 Phage integrase family protein [Desulforapulum autotrophicum HRM2]
MAKIAKRRDRYVLDFYDLEGKRKWITMPKGTTLKAAKEELRKVEDDLATGNYISPKKTPTFDQVAQEWLDHKKMNIRASTWAVYEGHTKNHFPEFKNLKIHQITIQRVEKFITDRQAAGMNLSTLRKILVSLRQIFNLAVKRGYCPRNPLDYADMPKSQGEETDGADKIQILTHDQITAFLEVVTEQKYHVLFSLAIFSGARQGELLGLKWSDILWGDSQIHIQRSFNNQRFYDTKTKGSNRKIDIGPVMLKKLKKWRLACPPGGLDLVFPTAKGNPMNHNNMVNRYFLPGLKAAKLERIRFHDMRHTYASLLIDQGENIKYIQAQLGHSNPTVTLNVYAHLMKGTNREAACRLEDAVLK